MFEDENVPEEPTNENENESLDRDKIFDNNFESTGYDGSGTSFNISSQYNTGPDFLDKLEYDMAWETIQELIKGSKLMKFNEPDKDGTYKKLNKLQINEVYSYVVMKLPLFPRVQVFSVLQDYFDINSSKFYDSLSNTFKKELIEELRMGGDLKEKTGGPLF